MRKMDEMEMAISLKAVRFAWFYTVVFLFIWVLYDFIKHGKIKENPAFLLLITQNIVLITSQLYLKNKMVKDEK